MTENNDPPHIREDEKIKELILKLYEHDTALSPEKVQYLSELLYHDHEIEGIVSVQKARKNLKEMVDDGMLKCPYKEDWIYVEKDTRTGRNP